MVKQSTGQFSLREPALASYRTFVQKLMDKFEDVSFEHSPRSENGFPDALATLGARLDVPEDTATIIIHKKTEPSCILGKYPEDLPEDWRGAIVKLLKTGEGTLSIMRVAQYMLLHGELYYREPGGSLARCLGKEEAKLRLNQIHEKSCGDGDVSLYRRVQHQGYYRPELEREAGELQLSCPRCQIIFCEDECCFMGEVQDWRQVYIDYLREGSLPPDRINAARVRSEPFASLLNKDNCLEGALMAHPCDASQGTRLKQF